MDAIIEKIIDATFKGEDHMDDGVLDLAFDQFIKIRVLAKKLKEMSE